MDDITGIRVQNGHKLDIDWAAGKRQVSEVPCCLY